MKPTRYEILRQVENSHKGTTDLSERPKQVWTLLNEDMFNKTGVLSHWQSGFIEDYVHDWDWRDGKFRYFPHSSGPGQRMDVVIVYEGE